MNVKRTSVSSDGHVSQSGELFVNDKLLDDNPDFTVVQVKGADPALVADKVKPSAIRTPDRTGIQRIAIGKLLLPAGVSSE